VVLNPKPKQKTGAGARLLLEVERDVAELLLDVARDLLLCRRREWVAPAREEDETERWGRKRG